MYCKRGQLGSKTHSSKAFSHTPHSNKQVFTSITRVHLITFSYRDFDVHKIDMQCGICNDDPQKICFDFRKICFDFRFFFFFNFQSGPSNPTKIRIPDLNMLIDFFLVFLLQKIEFEFVCFLEKNKCFTSIVLSIQFT